MTYRIISSLQFACSRTIVSCIGTFILCKTVLFCRKILTILRPGRLIGKCSFNVAKCNSMRTTRNNSNKHILHDYTLHQQTLENVRSAKYLGITITDNMDWGQHISEKVIACRIWEKVIVFRIWEKVIACRIWEKVIVCRICEKVISCVAMPG